MKKLFFFILLVTAACGKGHHESEDYSLKNGSLTPSQFEEMISDTTVLLDVRTPEEFAEGFIAGAVNLDYKADQFEHKLDSLDKSRTYLVYCAAGGRSDKAAQIMKAKGFTSIVTLDGGMNAWTADGRPVRK
jgi:rhodanese-related sulfurtransferase